MAENEPTTDHPIQAEQPTYEKRFTRLEALVENCADVREFLNEYMDFSEQLDAHICTDRISHEHAKAALKRSADLLLRANQQIGRWRLSV